MKYYSTVLSLFVLPAVITLHFTACDDKVIDPVRVETGGGNGGDTTNQKTGLPPGYDLFGENVEVYLDGDYIVIKSNGVPDHGSPYFDQSHEFYEAYNGNNPQFRLNPNRIREQNLTFRIPLHPVEAQNHSATPMGPIGVSVNGVPFYNQYAAGGSPLAGEINSFDQYNGHPQQTGGYHYHVEPLSITAKVGKSSLLGFLLDGFPVYGPEENAKVVTNDDLDDYHGHFGATKEYPEGIYHYHITDADPYLNGAGYFGVKGTVSQ